MLSSGRYNNLGGSTTEYKKVVKRKLWPLPFYALLHVLAMQPKVKKFIASPINTTDCASVAETRLSLWLSIPRTKKAKRRGCLVTIGREQISVERPPDVAHLRPLIAGRLMPIS
jgi:hypothetical protein